MCQLLEILLFILIKAILISSNYQENSKLSKI